VQVQALKKEFSGYVRNLPDGSVEACVSCKETRLTEFLAILHAGSDISRVDSVDTKEIDERFEGNFEVR
jgi:acylphosphatase